MWEKFKNSRLVMHVKDSRAVYVTVLTLILALAVLVTVAAVTNRAKKKEAEELGNNTPSTSQSQPQGDANNGTQQADPPSTVRPEPDTGSSSSDAQDTTTAIPELALPVVGPVSKGYDASIQVYSSTMGDYRIHLGLDMSTEASAPVLAAADGVISQIWDDSMMGKCIAVSHAGDCFTIYKNLDPSLPDEIAVGVEVKAGEVLGLVGQSAVLELAEEPHLHFEMTVGGLSVDPLEYFSEQAMAQLSEASDATETSVQAAQ